jgi:hypothetical protein
MTTMSKPCSRHQEIPALARGSDPEVAVVSEHVDFRTCDQRQEVRGGEDVLVGSVVDQDEVDVLVEL